MTFKRTLDGIVVAINRSVSSRFYVLTIYDQYGNDHILIVNRTLSMYYDNELCEFDIDYVIGHAYQFCYGEDDKIVWSNPYDEHAFAIMCLTVPNVDWETVGLAFVVDHDHDPEYTNIVRQVIKDIADAM